MGLTRPFRGAAAPALALALVLATASTSSSPAEPGPAGPGPAAARPGGGPDAPAPNPPAPDGSAPPALPAVALLALGGFDPVSYFLEGGPLAGSAGYELAWGGRVWRFRGPSDRAAFREAPAAYAPRLGGYDAAGVLDGRLVDADPLAFAVIDGRLYLFRDRARRARFLAEPDLARRAEAAWPGLAGLLDAPPVDGAP